MAEQMGIIKMKSLSTDAKPLRKVYKIIFVALFSGLNFCCTPVKFTITQPKQVRKEYYSFKEGVNNNLSLIDTNHIYVNEEDWVQTGDYGKRTKHLYVLLKFSQDGVAYYSDCDDKPFTRNSASMIAGRYCYYRINSDQLQLEFYDRRYRKRLDAGG